MHTMLPRLLCLLPVLGAGCATTHLDLAKQRQNAASAIASLQASKFEQAEREADEQVRGEPRNVYSHLVLAITGYKKTMHQLSTDVRTVVLGAFRGGGLNHRYMRSTLEQTAEELAKVDKHLAAAQVPGVALELCLACWEIDWNRNGEVDERDKLLFQIEQDAQGKEIPENDPRRRPTFRFDVGDVAWARAFISFHRAALDLVLAYEWSELDKLLTGGVFRRLEPTIVIRMARPALVTRGRQRILEGLNFADEARRAYLAETDDDREWLPNPRQRNHPLPLPVDEKLYRTWEDLLGDLQRLLQSKDGLSVEQVAQLGDHRWEHPPRGYIDIGKMLRQPKDITINTAQAIHLATDRGADVEKLLHDVLGDYYVGRMRPSPITSRFARMKNEMQRGEETMERKLRYLFWLN